MKKIEVQLTLKKILEIWTQISSLERQGIELKRTLVYWLGRNQDRLEPIVKRLKKADEADDAYQKYLKELSERTESHLLKDDQGVVINSAQGPLVANKSAYDQDLASLRLTYKDVLSKRDELFEAEETLILFPMKLEAFPETLSLLLMRAVSVFIDPDSVDPEDLNTGKDIISVSEVSEQLD